ncbi:alginate lyase family protein [Actinoplanes sp. NBRC 101535]|uniref:alginate lyase family protein n=1 Tax=Actinoplanes sp. NBRC 101535 TaxID=3032196 RepID=UPI002553F3C5|nr:alginate lyase family protein [Actinoplanes sp. NBRC 101535]
MTGLAVAATASPAGAAHAAAPLTHPGMLHTEADFTRIRTRLAADDPVVTAGWKRLTDNPRSNSTWKPAPTATVVRGGTGQNYVSFYRDVHAAYQNALRWRISGATTHGDTARDILNTWSRTLTEVTGNADRFLAAGIYGHQFANAAELMRGYDGFDLAAARTMLRRAFLPSNEQFLNGHNGACITNYWANWDLCTLASVLAIGILCDDRTIVNRAVTYAKNGAGNGAIRNAVPFLHGDLGQWQESGRDQAHSLMGVGLMATICEMAWNQGIDLYGYDDNRFLKGAEYVARYNLGHQVPYTTYRWGHHTTCAPREQTVISDAGRGQMRPVWEMVLHHYVSRQGLAAPNVAAIAARGRVEGGGGDYGPNSGGYDALGFGTLLYTRQRAVTRTEAASSGQSPQPPAPAPAAPAPVSSSSTPSQGPTETAAAPAPTATANALDLTAQTTGDSSAGSVHPAGTAWAATAAVTAALASGMALLRRRQRPSRHAPGSRRYDDQR